MWLIEKIESRNIETKEVSCTSSLSIDRYYFHIYTVRVHMRETNLGLKRVLSSRKGSYEVFLEILNSYNPYCVFTAIDGVTILLAVDEISWKFLGLVETVELLDFDDKSLPSMPLLNYNSQFCDENLTVLTMSANSWLGRKLTLFQRVLYDIDWFIGDKYYIGVRNGKVARVSFTNYDEARRFVLKAKMSGYEPFISMWGG